MSGIQADHTLVGRCSQVPAIWYDAPKDADPEKPPKDTFILPESALIVEFLADVYPSLTCKSDFFSESFNPTTSVVSHNTNKH